MTITVLPPVQDIALTLNPITGAAKPTSFIDSFVTMADDFGAWLSHPTNIDNFVAFSDNAGAVAVTTPQAPVEVGQAASDAVDAAGNAITSAVSSATQDAANKVGTLALWGAIGVLGFMVLKRATQ